MAQIIRNHYVLAVPDAEKTAQFFIEVMGFGQEPVEDEGWRFVRKDDVIVMLGSCPDAIPPDQLGDHSYFAYFVVDDVDAYHAEIAAKGATLHKAPRDEPWKMREMALRTPDGHRIMVGQPI